MKTVTEQRYRDINALIWAWSRTTYKEGLEKCGEFKNKKEIKTITFEILEMQGLTDKYMDGHSVERLPYHNQAGTGIVYSEIFSRLKYLSPVSYVGAIIEKCVELQKNDREEIACIVGRGIRNMFGSFLRELDLKQKLSRYFPVVERVKPLQDVKEHTDIIVEYNNQEYKLWSYLNHKDRLIYTALRIRGMRGTLPEGIHVLCPLSDKDKFEYEKRYGWILYSPKYVEVIHEIIVDSTPDDYFAVKKQSVEHLNDYIKRVNIFKK